KSVWFRIVSDRCEWTRIDSDILVDQISDCIIIELNNLVTQLIANDDSQNTTNRQSKATNLIVIIEKLKNKSFRKSLLNELAIRFYCSNFPARLDSGQIIC